MEAGGPGPRMDSQLSKSSGQSKKQMKPAIPRFSSPSKNPDNFTDIISKANFELEKSKNRIHLTRLDQLKFKMSMQNKNLKLLTGHNKVMQGIYQDEQGRANKFDDGGELYSLVGKDAKKLVNIKRQNTSMQNQQIHRVERDIERTSK